MGYYQTHYTSGNTTLIVIGNILPDEALKQVQAYLGGLEQKGRPSAARPSIQTPRFHSRRFQLPYPAN